MRIVLACIFVLILNSNTLSGQSPKDESSLTSLHQEVPNFEFIPVGSTEKIDLKALTGKTVLLNFFATWCGPCMKEIPFLKSEIYEPNKSNKDFVIIMIGRAHSEEEVAAFKMKKDIPFHVVADKDRTIYNLFAQKYIPRNYLVSPEGKIVYQSIGFQEEEFSNLVEKVQNTINSNN